MICPECRYVVPEPKPLTADYATLTDWNRAMEVWRALTADTRGMCACPRCQTCWDLAQVRGKLQVCHCGTTAAVKE